MVKKFHVNCATGGILNSDISYLSQKLTGYTLIIRRGDEKNACLDPDKKF
jgi:hypothetical protein